MKYELFKRSYKVLRDLSVIFLLYKIGSEIIYLLKVIIIKL